jgi:hypothetical protein
MSKAHIMEAKESSEPGMFNLDVSDPNFSYSSCPCCNASFDGGLILDKFKQVRDNLKAEGKLETKEYEWYQKTDEEFETLMKESYSEPYRFSELMGIEVPNLYDGVLAFKCEACGSYWARFTGEYLGNNLTADQLMGMKDKLNRVKIVKSI